jgi:hypothetical protein
MSTPALSQAEYEILYTWSCSVDEPVRSLQIRLLNLYKDLAHDQRKAAEMLKAMRLAMGLIPKSERGLQILENK